MKRINKIILISFSAILAIVLLFALTISPIIKSYIVNNAQELVGRNIAIDKLSVNIFNGKIKVEGFTLFEENGTDKFVSFEKFELNATIWKIITKKIYVESITLSKADVKLYQNVDKFNFDDIIAHFTADSTQVEQDTTSSDWGIELYNIGINNSQIIYSDQSVGSQWEMEDFSLVIPGINLSGKNTDMGVTLNFMEGGSLQTNLRYDLQKKNYDLNLILNQFSLSALLPYLQQSMNVSKVAGMLNLNINISGDTQHVMDFNVSGNAALAGFDLLDNRSHQIVGIDSVFTDFERINLEEKIFAFNALKVNGLRSSFEQLSAEKNNFSDLFKPELPADAGNQATADTTKMKISIADLDVRNCDLKYSDLTLPKKFVYEISNIALKSENFDPDKINSVNISALMQKTGSVKVKWTGSATDISNQNILIALKNVNLDSFSPYTLSMFGYPITKGNMSFTSQNIIKNNMLNGANSLNVYQPAMGAKDKSIKSEYNVPIKLGLYIMTDKDGKIDLDLPVSGNVSSPEFSYKKIIIKALVNVLVKVATAPANFLTSSLGLKSDDFQYINLNCWQRDFTPEQFSKFNTLGEILTKKPELTITLNQQINHKEALKELSLANLKVAYYTSLHPEKANQMLELIDREAFMGINIKAPEFISFTDAQLSSLNKDLSGDIYTKAQTLYSEKADEQLRQSIITREEKAKAYLTSQLGIDPAKISFSTLTAEEMSNYNGKDRFEVQMNVGD